MNWTHSLAALSHQCQLICRNRREPFFPCLLAGQDKAHHDPLFNANKTTDATGSKGSSVSKGSRMSTRLCETCSVIEFNDEPLRPFVTSPDDGPPSLTVDSNEKIMLEYHVLDFYPSLLLLQQSALGGCDFCSLLRHEIIRAQFDYRGFIGIKLRYHWGDLQFPGLGLAALVAELAWLPHLPSILPSSEKPDVVRNCIIFTLETDNGRLFSPLLFRSMKTQLGNFGLIRLSRWHSCRCLMATNPETSTRTGSRRREREIHEARNRPVPIELLPPPKQPGFYPPVFSIWDLSLAPPVLSVLSVPRTSRTSGNVRPPATKLQDTLHSAIAGASQSTGSRSSARRRTLWRPGWPASPRAPYSRFCETPSVCANPCQSGICGLIHYASSRTTPPTGRERAPRWVSCTSMLSSQSAPWLQDRVAEVSLRGTGDISKSLSALASVPACMATTA